MKVLVQGQSKITAIKAISAKQFGDIARLTAGKEVTIDIDASASVNDLAEASRSAMGVDGVKFEGVQLSMKPGQYVKDNSVKLSELGIRDGSKVSMVFHTKVV